MTSDTSPATVTVIIPTYNRAHWLGGAIQSVLDQTYEDFVLMVSDNASTDHTPEVVASFSDPRISYVRRPRNVGLLENHNLSLDAVSTKYALILPDDDVLFPQILEKTVAVLDEHPNAGMVHCSFDVIAASGETVTPRTNWTYGLEGDTVEPGHDFVRESMTFSCRVCASTALMRMDALKTNRFDPADFPAIDFGMWLRMAVEWDMAFLDQPMAGYRIHGQSHSAGFGPPVPDGYVQDLDIVTKLRDLKLRFLDRYGARLPDPEGLRRLAGAGMRRELVLRVKGHTLPERRLSPTVRMLAEAVRLDPRLALDPAALRVLAASFLTPRVVDRLKDLAGRER